MSEPDPNMPLAPPPISSSSDSQPQEPLLQRGAFDPPVTPGTLGRLDRFVILRLLGEGGMGQVYLAREPRTDTRVAVKILRPQMADDPQSVHRFLTEARHMYRLSHPRILRVLEVSDRKQGPYYVMPYVEGGSLLGQYRPDKPMPTERILVAAKQVAEALAHAHAHGLIHRDLKPGNVLLEKDGNAYLTDFGLVRTVFNDSLVDASASHLEGTAPYMSPAVARGEAEDTRCDIYAFGALLYELLAGQPPYTGRSSQIILDQVLKGPPTPLREVNPKASPALVRISEGCMARELRDRYASMADVVADLDRVAAGQAPFGPHRQQFRLPRRAALLAGTLAVAALAGYAVYHFTAASPVTAKTTGVQRPASGVPAQTATPPATAVLSPPAATARPPTAEPDIAEEDAEEELPPENSPLPPAAKVQGPFAYTVTNGAATILKYTGPAEAVTVPSTIDGFPVTAIGNCVFDSCKSLTAVTVPNGVTTIGEAAFVRCPKLASLTIPASVLSMKLVCWACTAVTSIVVDAANPVYSSADGVVFDKARTCLIRYPVGKAGDYVIPNSVTHIGGKAFHSCAKLAGLTIPASVISVGDWAFANTRLTKVTLPASVAGIGRGAFADCLALSSVYFEGHAPHVGSNVFNKADKATVFYRPGTTGWGKEFGGRPTAVWGSVMANVGSQATAPALSASPWTNSLGMVFVPVPGTAVRFSIWDTRVQDYQAFAAATSRAWEKPGVEQGPTHPAVMVSWDDAQAFCAWLTKKEWQAGTLSVAREYRLPTDLEWSAAVGLGSETGSTPKERSEKVADVYPWGTQWPPPRGAGNYHPDLKVDDFVENSPVGRFAANRYGLYDMGGNVTQWCEDFYDGPGGLHVTRGSGPKYKSRASILSSYLHYFDAGYVGPGLGFRCVLAQVRASASKTSSHSSDSVESPLDMQSDIAEDDVDNELLPDIPALSPTAKSQGPFAYISTNGVVTLVAYTGPGGAVAIPGEINGQPVTGIGDPAFSGCTNLTSVTIPNSVKGIGLFAFGHCANLSTVTIPSSVTWIGFSFADCSRLTSIRVDAANPAYCSSADGVVFNKKMTKLIRCPGGKAGSYVIPSTVTEVGNWAFSGCSSLTHVTIPDSVTNIGEWTFNGCTGLVDITIPNSVTNIKGWAFNNCAGLTRVTLSDSVTAIDRCAFQGCSSLTRITIPASVTSIGRLALYRCKSLAGVYFEGDVPPVSEALFFPNSKATVYYRPGTKGWGKTFNGLPTAVWDRAMTNDDASGDDQELAEEEELFANTSVIPPTAKVQGPFTYTATNGAVTIVKYTGPGGAVTIPSAINGFPVTCIARSAFENCTSLTNVTISDSVTLMKGWQFIGCDQLTSIMVDAKNPAYSGSAEGVLFNKEKTALINYPVGRIGSYVIPHSVTGIGKWSFAGCTKLTSVTIPNSVTSIGEGAFDKCISLTNGMIPNSVTNIAESVFARCASLVNVTSLGSVSSIPEWTFYGCSSLISVTIPDSVTTIARSAFENCTSLTSVTIPQSAISIGSGAFRGCESLTAIYFKGNPPKLNKDVFVGSNNAIIYYLPGTKGWGKEFGGRPTAEWKP